MSQRLEEGCQTEGVLSDEYKFSIGDMGYEAGMDRYCQTCKATIQIPQLLQ